MRKWKGKQLTIGQGLPAEIQKALRRRSRHVLERHGIADELIDKIVSALVHQVSWAYNEREYKLEAEGPGRPVSGPACLLSVNVADLLKEHGVRGNWLRLGDDDEEYVGPVTELEAIAQTAFREACGEQVGVMARPARISKARKTLGKVHRTKLPDLIVRVPIFGAGPIIVHWIADEEIA
jgi:hypothetical protein